MKFLALSVMSLMFSTASQATTSGRYALELIERNVSANIVPPRYQADLDEDGIPDRIRIGRQPGFIEVNFSTGRIFRHDLNEDLHDIRMSFHSFQRDGRFPSIVVAHLAKPWRSGSRPQVILRNSDGNLSAVTTQKAIAARDVACFRRPASPQSTCIWAAYKRESSVMQIDDDFQIRDVTRESKFPVPTPGYNGYHGMGLTISDLNKDGSPDVTFSGQHADILVAYGADKDMTRFIEYERHDPSGEHMTITPVRFGAVSGQNSLPQYVPCTYHGMERNESPFNDFLLCFSNESGDWYQLEFQGIDIRMNGDVPRILKVTSDQNAEFLVKTTDNKWHRYSLKYTESSVGAGNLVSGVKGQCVHPGRLSSAVVPALESCTYADGNWRLEPTAGSDHYRLRQGENLCITSSADTSDLLAYMQACSDSPTQMFQIQHSLTHFRLTNKYSGKCLSADGIWPYSRYIAFKKCADVSRPDHSYYGQLFLLMGAQPRI